MGPNRWKGAQKLSFYNNPLCVHCIGFSASLQGHNSKRLLVLLLGEPEEEIDKKFHLGGGHKVSDKAFLIARL